MSQTKKKKKLRPGFIIPKVLWGLCLVASVIAGFWIARTQIVLSSAGQVDNALRDVELPEGTYKSDKKIVNVLIVGNDYRVESDGFEAPGFPDTIMIATLDMKHKNLKLTSLMRDQVVDIAGSGSEDKLNACYSPTYGSDGITVLYKTLAQNFNIRLDGYAELSFKAVEEVVNSVGGIEVELTESESSYLNSTNYIRKKKYRNVKTGINQLNGAQALGYSRIRKTVVTPTGLIDDYGRTWRQRNVVNGVFTKVKKMSPTQLMDLAQTIFQKYVKTDLKSSDILSYVKDVVMMGTTDIYQLQIPVQGYFDAPEEDYISAQGRNLGSVLLINKEANAEALDQFIFDFKGTKGQEFVYAPSGSSGNE